VVYASKLWLVVKHRFPSDALKLHQSFVQEITVDPGDATIVSAMIDMGKGLQKRVIAEGVETRAQLEFLKRHGCDEAQGYYFSRPVTAEQASKFLEFGLPVQTEAEIHNHNKASFVK
jgi:EAL domain-containing protein (putative c-di-GMP-specific phosphodiesterase class I)